MKYRKKSLVVEAVQWLQLGDHSQVTNFRPPEDELPNNPYCPTCGNLMQRHGLLDGAEGLEIVCPSDYIVTNSGGIPYRRTRAEFEAMYEPYVRPPRHAEVPSSDLEEQRRQRQLREKR